MTSRAQAEIAARPYSLSELMVAAAAREISDAELVFVGMRLPLLAFLVAKRTHAPSAIGLYENGVIRERPAPELLYTMADPPNLRGATQCGQMLDIMRAVTGWDLTPPDLVTLAHRGLTLARLFNLREGFTTADDRLPPRFSDPLPKHPGLTLEQQRKIVTDYYVEQGWDAEAGTPTAETIEALRLTEDAARAV